MRAFPNIRPRHVAIALVFGGLSTLIASWGELGLMLDAFPMISPVTLRQPTALIIILVSVIAPFVEELAKPLGLYFIQGEEKPNFQVKEWALLGALAGLGFAIIENFMYAATLLPFGTEPALNLLFLRFLMPLHMIASCIAGWGFGMWMKTRNAKYFAVCLFVAMLLHGLFNLAATIVG
jgi:RsiW-degrading membrane proteinase PrsW (M82 family)